MRNRYHEKIITRAKGRGVIIRVEDLMFGSCEYVVLNTTGDCIKRTNDYNEALLILYK